MLNEKNPFETAGFIWIYVIKAERRHWRTETAESILGFQKTPMSAAYFRIIRCSGGLWAFRARCAKRLRPRGVRDTTAIPPDILIQVMMFGIMFVVGAAFRPRKWRPGGRRYIPVA